MRISVPRAATSLALVAAVAAPAVAAAPASAAKKQTITMSGSTSVYPLASALTAKYVKLNKKVGFRVAQGGSDKGIADVAKGAVTIGMSSRDSRSTDPKRLSFVKIAGDAVCIITNPGNKLASGLSQKQVADIFSGKIRSWSEVPGSSQSGTISLQARNEASGTLDAFEKLFMGNASLSSTAARLASNGLIQAAVKRDPAAIGFVSMEFLSGVNAVNYENVACNAANAKSGKYKGTRSFWMVVKSENLKGETARFLNWVRTSKEARKIVVAQHAVPLK